MDEPNEAAKSLILLKREEAAKRAGYNSTREMIEDQIKQIQQKEERRQKFEDEQKRLHKAKLNRLFRAKRLLEECLEFQSQHGDRVRATIKDREAGERVVEENNENNRRILELEQIIKQLEVPK